MHYYEIAPTVIIRATSAVFTYYHEAELAVGSIVKISVGKKELIGIVVREVPKPEYATKSITEIIEIPPLPIQLIETSLWMADYYATHPALVFQAILPRGITRKRRERTSNNRVTNRDRTTIVFNPEQQEAIKTISDMTPGTALLHGITGSGKTAVYIELAKRVLQDGRSAMILVPEISLTSQLVAEFTQHFPDIILTHSRQTEAERHAAWLDALTSDKPRLAIGPRSALFLPLKSIGLIAIDEAHEPSYKQDQSPRYSALRVASILARAHNAKVVQGSATPLVSEYYLALHAKRPVISMTKKARLDSADPSVSLVDMTKRGHFSEHRLFSNNLLASLREAFANGNQALIFHNRRGSASTTLCEHCGWSAICPRCFVPYTLHADTFTLRCHICGNHEKVPTSCPVCYSTEIIHKGIGTKLIESELRKLFPDKVIARFDGDSANDETVENRYQELYDGSIDLIIGTQVIAKGLDLPKLRAVGVIQADAGLALPDYSAAERTFQLLAQVVGRVGRSSHASSIVVQSFQPQAAAVQMGIAQDYASFYTQAIADRERGHYPPFTYLLKLTCVYKTEAAAIRNAQQLSLKIKANYPGITVLGPTPAFYERQRDTYRWQLVIKYSTRTTLVTIAKSLPAQWQFDLDPTSLL